jgi:hypothetical protein
LIAQLRRLSMQQQSGRPPPSLASPLTLSTVLDAPPSGMIPQSASAAQKNSMWVTWLACTGQLLRRLSQARVVVGLPPL